MQLVFASLSIVVSRCIKDRKGSQLNVIASKTAEGWARALTKDIPPFLLTCLATLAPNALAAQEAKVSSIALHQCGLYSNKMTKKETDKTSASGTHNIVENNTLIRETRDIPNVQGTSFGCKIGLNGSPEGALVKVAVTLQGPNKTVKGSNSYPIGSSTEYVGITIRTLLEPGTWTLRAMIEGLSAAEAAFSVRSSN
jgi:hypothetical protein